MDALHQVMDPLRKSKADILHSLGCKDNEAVKEVENKMDTIRNTIGQVEHRQHVLAGQKEEFLQKHAKLLARVTLDNATDVAVGQERMQHAQQNARQKKLIDTYGTHYNSSILNHTIRITDKRIRKRTRESHVKMQPCMGIEDR